MKLKKCWRDRDPLIASSCFNFNGIANCFSVQYSFDDGEQHIIENQILKLPLQHKARICLFLHYSVYKCSEQEFSTLILLISMLFTAQRLIHAYTCYTLENKCYNVKFSEYRMMDFTRCLCIILCKNFDWKFISKSLSNLIVASKSSVCNLIKYKSKNIALGPKELQKSVETNIFGFSPLSLKNNKIYSYRAHCCNLIPSFDHPGSYTFL